MNLAIVGYGKMGRLVEQLASEYGFAVTVTLDEFNNLDFGGITPENFRGVDVAIEFSTPATVVGNIERVAALGVNLILLVNLAWSAVLYLRFLRGRGSFTSLEKWQTDYLPVYGARAVVVVILFPPLFRYI